MESSAERSYVYEPSHAIQWAMSLLLYSDNVAVTACEAIKKHLKYDFVAVQLTELLQQIIQTVHGSGLRGEWYKLGSHSLEVPEKFLDIQAYIAISRPPIIEIVEGEHPRFDRFIYDKFGHKHYARAFVPLILNRDENGRLTQVRTGDFDFHVSEGDRVIGLTPRSGMQRYEIIGTIEAGFDNANRREPLHVSPKAAITLFWAACEQANQLFPSTLWHVLQVIADRARDITGAAAAISRIPEGARLPYQAWSGLDPERYDRLPNSAKIHRSISSENRSGRLLEEDSGRPAVGALLLGFLEKPEVKANEQGRLDNFIEDAMGAIEHATYLVRSLHLARQLANLHDIAKLLACEPEHPDLLATIAGHVQNVLTADVVAIYGYQAGTFRQAEEAIVGIRFTPASFRWVPAIDLMQELQQGQIRYADTPAKLAELYGSGSGDDGAEQFVDLEQIKTAAIVPLRVSNDVVGVMLINFRRSKLFSRDDEKSIETAASTAAIAIRTKQLLSQRERDVEQLVHDLPEVMNGIVTTANQLKESADFMAGQSEVLRSISSAVRTVLGGSPGAEDKVLLDVHEILDRLRIVLRTKYGRRSVKLRYEEGFEGKPSICWSRTAFTYVAYALLDNAGKYADEQSTVRIDCASKEGRFRIRVISIGLPIAPHEEERIFNKFAQGEAARQARDRTGVGLGLFIARRMMEAYGGSLLLERSDRTSCFVMTIPGASKGGDDG